MLSIIRSAYDKLLYLASETKKAFVKNIFNKLAAITSPHETFLGIFPPLPTLLALTALAALAATGLWAGSFLLAGVSSYLPIFGTTLAWFIGGATFNLIFQRGQMDVELSARAITSIEEYNTDKNPINPVHMVDTLTRILNEHFSELDPNSKPMDPPALYSISDRNVVVKVAEGLGENQAALFISDGFFKAKVDQHQMAACLMSQLVKIRLRRGYVRAAWGALTDWIEKSKEWTNDKSFTFFMLNFIGNAMNRFPFYEAAKIVADMGLGSKLMDHIDYGVNRASLPPTPYQLKIKRIQRNRERAEFERRNPTPPSWLFTKLPAWVQNKLNEVAEWVKRQDEETDNRKSSIFIKFFMVVTSGAAKLFKELASRNPRATTLKEYLRQFLLAPLGVNKTKIDDYGNPVMLQTGPNQFEAQSERITADNADPNEFANHIIPAQDQRFSVLYARAANRLANQVAHEQAQGYVNPDLPMKTMYAAIAPGHNGYVSPGPRAHRTVINAPEPEGYSIQEMQQEIANQQTQIQQLQAVLQAQGQGHHGQGQGQAQQPALNQNVIVAQVVQQVLAHLNQEQPQAQQVIVGQVMTQVNAQLTARDVQAAAAKQQRRLEKEADKARDNRQLDDRFDKLDQKLTARIDRTMNDSRSALVESNDTDYLRVEKAGQSRRMTTRGGASRQ